LLHDLFIWSGARSKGAALLHQLEDIYNIQEDLNRKEQRVAKIDSEINSVTRVAER
jgi:uncharacterized protein YlxW (UPF0749 family)